MEIRGLTGQQIESAATTAKVTLYRMRPVGHTRDGRPKFRLQLHTTRDDEGRVIFGRLGFSENRDGSRRRCPGAVCWHGHRAFMRACYALVPDAKIVTAFITYTDAENFERSHTFTAERQAGSAYRPVTFGELCECDDEAGIYTRETKRRGKPGGPLHTDGRLGGFGQYVAGRG